MKSQQLAMLNRVLFNKTGSLPLKETNDWDCGGFCTARMSCIGRTALEEQGRAGDIVRSAWGTQGMLQGRVERH